MSGDSGGQSTHKPAVFYRCHCSLCRKQSGVGYNLATLVKDSEFRWIKGENCIASWSKPFAMYVAQLCLTVCETYLMSGFLLV
nr:GFA family protein [Klebsiella grimontii]